MQKYNGSALMRLPDTKKAGEPQPAIRLPCLRARLKEFQTGSKPERFSWEERDGVADSFAKRGESEARADGGP